MQIFNLSVKSIFKSKYSYIVLTILVLVIFIFVFDVYINKKKNTELPDSLISDTYIAKYNVTIISNKTTNTYYIVEYKDHEKYRFEFLDRQQHLVTMIFNNETVYIENASQYAKFTLDEYVTSQNNLMSYSTICEIYNFLKKNNINCQCKLSSYMHNEEYVVEMKSGDVINDNCMLCNIFNNTKKTNIKLILNDSFCPVLFTIYDKTNREQICVVYESFEFDVPDMEKFVIKE